MWARRLPTRFTNRALQRCCTICRDRRMLGVVCHSPMRCSRAWRRWRACSAMRPGMPTATSRRAADGVASAPPVPRIARASIMNQPYPTINLAPVAPSPEQEQEEEIYEVRKKVYPRAVHGWFAGWRVFFVILTQLVFYGLAWLNWNGRQAVLFDLASRKFYIFGL